MMQYDHTNRVCYYYYYEKYVFTLWTVDYILSYRMYILLKIFIAVCVSKDTLQPASLSVYHATLNKIYLLVQVGLKSGFFSLIYLYFEGQRLYTFICWWQINYLENKVMGPLSIIRAHRKFKGNFKIDPEILI